MDCDIHLRAEVWTDGAWHLVGEVFDSTRKATTVWATREDMEPLSDFQILHGAVVELAQPGARAALGTAWPEVSSALHFVEGLRHEMRARVAIAREDSRARGGDYERDVLPVELAEYRRLDEAVCLSPEARDALIDALDGFRWDEEGESSAVLALHRREGDPPFKTAMPWEGRNDALFAILADVRNGSGSDRLSPVAKRRGGPRDVSPEGAEFMRSYGEDGHSHTYLFLSELLQYDWDERRQRKALVPEEEFLAAIAGRRRPRYSAPGVGGTGVHAFTPEEYHAWVAAGRLEVEGQEVHRAWVRMAYEETCREAVGEAWFATLAQLKVLIPHGDDAVYRSEDDRVRLLMFFEN